MNSFGVHTFRRENGYVVSIMKSRNDWIASVFRPSEGDPTKPPVIPLAQLACGRFDTLKDAEAFLHDQIPRVLPDRFEPLLDELAGHLTQDI